MREKKWCAKTIVMTRATSHLMRGKKNSLLVDASADFVESLIFTNIKVVIARLFYERDYKTFTDFRLFFNIMFVHHMV